MAASMPSKKSGKTRKMVGGQRYKSKESTGFNIKNKWQPKESEKGGHSRRVKKG